MYWFFIFAPVLFWLGRSIPGEEQVKVLDSLLQISGIIFGVMGAWIAIIYPKALKNYFGKTLVEKLDTSIQIDSLMKTMKISSTIVILCLVGRFSFPIAKALICSDQVKTHLRSICYVMTGFMIYLQILTVFQALKPMSDIQDEVDKEVLESKADAVIQGAAPDENNIIVREKNANSD